jgi:hypothetical protein
MTDDPTTTDPTARAREVRTTARMQDCKRGEHLYVTSKRQCPLCGEDL